MKDGTYFSIIATPGTCIPFWASLFFAFHRLEPSAVEMTVRVCVCSLIRLLLLMTEVCRPCTFSKNKLLEVEFLLLLLLDGIAG